MNLFFGSILFLAVGVILFAIHRLRGNLARGAGHKLSRKQFQERESERDRMACLAASRALDDHPAPREDHALAGAGSGAVGPREATAERSSPATAESRRRTAASSYFDPDIVGTHREAVKAPPA